MDNLEVNSKSVEHSRAQVDSASADLRRFFTYRIAALNRNLVKQSTKYFSRVAGLSVAEWRVIAMLGSYGELAASELADQALLDPGQNSRVTRMLGERGLVGARSDPADARRALFRLTGRGNALFKKTVKHSIVRQQKILDLLTAEEAKALDRALDKLMSWSPEGSNPG